MQPFDGIGFSATTQITDDQCSGASLDPLE
jgi:hypothetical protein